MRRWGLVVLVLWAALSPLGAEGLRWKAVLATGWASGDQGPLPNWEAARDAAHRLLLAKGVAFGDVRLLTAQRRLAGLSSRGAVLERFSKAALRRAVAELAPGPGEGLIVFLTSHGSRGEGWSIEHDGSGPEAVLTPGELAEALSPAEARPVLVLVSSCFSGQFLDQPGVVGPNRVLMTAARRDRSSFGCGVGVEMPEWDESLTRLWAALSPGNPGADPRIFAEAVADDIAAKEAGMAAGRHSLPQFAVGAEVGWSLP